MRRTISTGIRTNPATASFLYWSSESEEVELEGLAIIQGWEVRFIFTRFLCKKAAYLALKLPNFKPIFRFLTYVYSLMGLESLNKPDFSQYLVRFIVF